MNAKDKDEISGLMEASIMGHLEVVRALLKVTIVNMVVTVAEREVKYVPVMILSWSPAVWLGDTRP